MITVLLKTTSDERHGAGRRAARQFLRLLGVDDIDIEVPLGGNLIYLRNRDVPGVMGKIGTLLGRHNVNIANFALGRSETGGHRRGAGGHAGERSRHRRAAPRGRDQRRAVREAVI